MLQATQPGKQAICPVHSMHRPYVLYISFQLPLPTLSHLQNQLFVSSHLRSLRYQLNAITLTCAIHPSSKHFLLSSLPKNK